MMDDYSGNTSGKEPRLSDEEIRKLLLGDRNYSAMYKKAVKMYRVLGSGYFEARRLAKDFVASLKREEDRFNSDLKDPAIRKIHEDVGIMIKNDPSFK